LTSLLWPALKLKKLKHPYTIAVIYTYEQQYHIVSTKLLLSIPNSTPDSSSPETAIMSHHHALFVFASLTLGIVIKTIFSISTTPNKNQSYDEENNNDTSTPSSRIPRIVDALSEKRPVDRAWRQTQRFLEEQEQKLDTLHRELNTLMNEIKCIPSSEEKKKKKQEKEVVNGEGDSDADVGNSPGDVTKTLVSAESGFNNGSQLTARTHTTVIKTPLLLHRRGLGSINSKSPLVSLSPTFRPNSTGDDKKEQGAGIAAESLDILTDLLEKQPEEDALVIPVDDVVIEKLKEKAAMRRRSIRVVGSNSSSHKLTLGEEEKVVQVLELGGDFSISAA
jgi:hypothetical protein